jgi:hypothetical protein
LDPQPLDWPRFYDFIRYAFGHEPHPRRSLTWDRGREMGEHVRFTLDTGVQVCFCDPRRRVEFGDHALRGDRPVHWPIRSASATIAPTQSLADAPSQGIREAAMLSRAQEARVLQVLGDCPSGTVRTYCLEHLLAAIKIPSAHAFDLVTFIQALRAKGECEARYGGFCDAEGHDTDDLLVWRPDPPVAQGALKA